MSEHDPSDPDSDASPSGSASREARRGLRVPVGDVPVTATRTKSSSGARSSTPPEPDQRHPSRPPPSSSYPPPPSGEVVMRETVSVSTPPTSSEKTDGAAADADATERGRAQDEPRAPDEDGAPEAPGSETKGESSGDDEPELTVEAADPEELDEALENSDEVDPLAGDPTEPGTLDAPEAAPIEARAAPDTPASPESDGEEGGAEAVPFTQDEPAEAEPATSSVTDEEQLDLEEVEEVQDVPAKQQAADPSVPKPPGVPDASSTAPPPVPEDAVASAAESAGGSTEADKVAEPIPQQPRSRPWFEEFFNDDYLRTVPPPTDDQVKKQVDFMEHALQLEKGASILDVGCGLGLQAVELANRGYLVVGLDLSLPMLSRASDEAQEQGLKINFLHADMREMTFEGAFDAVVCWGTTFGYFDDETNRTVVDRMYRALKPMGLLMLDVVNRDHVIRDQPNLVWFEGDGCVCMEETDFNYITSRLEVKRTVILDDGRQRESHYTIRLYSLHELGQLVHQQGFRVTQVSGMEATPSVFLGKDSPRILMLAERRLTESEQNPNSAQGPSRPSQPDASGDEGTEGPSTGPRRRPDADSSDSDPDS